MKIKNIIYKCKDKNYHCAKKNWKVTDIYKFNIGQWNNDPTLIHFKNGGKINVKKNEKLVIKFMNKKTGQVFHTFYDCGFNHTTDK